MYPHDRDPGANGNERATRGTNEWRASHTRSHGRLGVEHRIDPARGETRARAEARRRSRRRRPQGTCTRTIQKRARETRDRLEIDRAIEPESRSRLLHRRRPRAVTMGDRSRVRWSRARWSSRVASRPSRSSPSTRVGRVVPSGHPSRYGRIDAKGPRGVVRRVHDAFDAGSISRREGRER